MPRIPSELWHPMPGYLVDSGPVTGIVTLFHSYSEAIVGINTGRVVIGGLAAGATRTVGDGLATTLIFAASYRAEVGKLNAALPAVIETASAKIGIVTINFLLGIALVFAYAAMRPRYGAGAVTALRAGLLVWAVGSLAWAVTGMLGLFSWGYLIPRVFASLVSVLIAACVGAMLYTEPESTPVTQVNPELPPAEATPGR